MPRTRQTTGLEKSDLNLLDSQHFVTEVYNSEHEAREVGYTRNLYCHDPPRRSLSVFGALSGRTIHPQPSSPTSCVKADIDQPMGSQILAVLFTAESPLTINRSSEEAAEQSVGLQQYPLRTKHGYRNAR